MDGDAEWQPAKPKARRAAPPSAKPAPAAPPAARLPAVCRFWAAGHCSAGEHCAYRHSKDVVQQKVARPPPTTPALPSPAAPQPLTMAMLDAAPPERRKALLGARLYPLLAASHPHLAPKLTGMLLEMPPALLLRCLAEPDELAAKVSAAVAALVGHPAASASADAPSAAEPSSSCAAAEEEAAAAAPPPAADDPYAPSRPVMRAPAASAPAAPPAAPPPPPPPAAPAARRPATLLVPTPAEERHSAELTCGICLDPVLSPHRKGGAFGLLEGCDHSFCHRCLREWRQTHALRPDVARACPECRTPSHFVVPCAVHLTGERKHALVRECVRLPPPAPFCVAPPVRGARVGDGGGRISAGTWRRSGACRAATLRLARASARLARRASTRTSTGSDAPWTWPGRASPRAPRAPRRCRATA